MPDRGVVADFLGMFLDTMLSDHGKCADVPVLSDRPSA